MTTATKLNFVFIHGVTIHNYLDLRLRNMDGMKGKRFSLGLWLLVTQSYHYIPLASGQQGKLINNVYHRCLMLGF